MYATAHSYFHDRSISDRAKLLVFSPSKTQQSFANDADINTIVKRFIKDGELPPVTQTASYGDFTSVDSYHSALIKVQAANDMFASLPATIRSRFRNDPAEYLEFFKDSKNIQEAVNLGLMNIDPRLAAAHAQARAVADAERVPEATPAPAPVKGAKHAKKRVSSDDDD